MSTLKINLTARRMALLAQTEDKIFHINDIANLWDMQNKNTLRTILSRYCRNGVIHRLYRGFYSLLPPQKINPLLIGAKAIHRFCYLSTETVLFRDGYISQAPYVYTFISNISLQFTVTTHSFRCRKLHEKFLHQSVGIVAKNNVREATIERAIADMLYFNPFYHFDRPIDWTAIKTMQKKIGYPLTPKRYGTPQAR